MTLLYAACVAGLGISAALGHSWLGEHKVFRPLYAEPQVGMLRNAPTRDVIRIVWHLPSITWAVLGLAVLGSRLGAGSTILSLAATMIFAASGIGNFTALRRAHFGGAILLAASALTLLDWHIHISV